MHHLRTATLLGIAITMTACGSKPAPEPTAPVQAEQARPARNDGDDAAARRAAEEAAARREAEAVARRNAATLAEMVFFDYDISTIRADQRPVLDAKVPILRADPSIRIRIEGHADDRGSTEYNLALGQRRAQSILEYLTGFGLDASRFEIVSYGEERPLVQGRGEASWARNRRGEFAVTGGRTAMDHAR